MASIGQVSAAYNHAMRPAEVAVAAAAGASMSADTSGYSRRELEQLLSLLNEELQRVGITGEVCIVGGAAMVLAFGSRTSTRDIDALVMEPAAVRAAAARVAEAHGLPVNWLNDGIKEFASGRPIETKSSSASAICASLRRRQPTSSR